MVKSTKSLLCMLLTIMMVFGMLSFMPQAEPIAEAAEVEVEQVGATKYAPATDISSSYTTKYYPAYTGSKTGIVNVLDDMGIESDKYHRTKIGVFNGMTDYSCTADDNTALLKLIKAGTCLNPDYVEEATGTTKYAPATTKSSDITTKYYPKYTGSETGLAAALSEMGIKSDKYHRTKIGVFNGMLSYSCTPEDNTALFKLLKAGTCLNPDYTGTSSTTKATTKATTTASTGSTGTTKYPEATTKCSDYTTKYYPAYTGTATSLNDALSEMGINNSKNHRTTIAVFNGMTAYQLTPEENNAILKLLKEGKLLNPDYDGSSSSTTATEPTEEVIVPATSLSSSYTSRYFPAYTGTESSLVTALNSLSIQSSKAHRLKIAIFNGMSDYTFTPAQNLELLGMLKEGALLNPDYTGGSADPSETAATTAAVTPATSKSSDYTTKYYPAYTGTSSSITTALTSLSITSTKAHRLKIAIFNGMSDYTFTPEQNLELLGLLKAGTLLNPDYTVKISYYPKYTGTSSALVTALNSLGIDSSKEHRMEIALANGISDYTYTPEQNTQMLNLLKAGKLIDPDNSNVSTTVATSPAGTGSAAAGGAYDSAYEGGAAGTGKILAHGIDVSKHNEKDSTTKFDDVDFNFAAAKKADMDYVIIRAGSTNLGEDPMFDMYYDAAKKAGFHVGAYFYSYAMTASEAKSDANKFLSYIKGKTFEYPCYLDFEDPTQRDGLTKAQKTTVCLAFMDIIADAGYMTGVYTGKSMSGGMDIDTICAKYELWIAHYPNSKSYTTYGAAGSTYSKAYGMYQYTSEKSISGVTGVVDANVCYKDYPTLIKKYGFNGYSNGGWKTTTSGKRYLYNDGSYATGWFQDGSNKYYLNPSNGYAYTGLKIISDTVYSFASTGILSETCGLVGDVDGSGGVKVGDVTYIQKIGVGLVTTVTDENKLMGDVNGDGKIDIKDASFIQGYLARSITKFPACK